MPVNTLKLICLSGPGIGKETAKRLAEAGATVVVASRTESKLQETVNEITSAGKLASYVVVDVKDDASVRDAFEDTAEKYGKIDFVFVNQGWASPETNKKAFWELSDGALAGTIDVEIIGVLRVLKHAVRLMRQQEKGGKVVITSGIESVFKQEVFSMAKPPGTFLHMTAARAGTDAIVRAAAGSFLGNGIGVYGLNYACVRTPEFVEFAASMNMTPEAMAVFNPVWKDKLGEPKYIAEAILAIFDGSSTMRSGESWVVDGASTFSIQHLYSSLQVESGDGQNLGWPAPNELMQHLKDLKGRIYKKDEL